MAIRPTFIGDTQTHTATLTGACHRNSVSVAFATLHLRANYFFQCLSPGNLIFLSQFSSSFSIIDKIILARFLVSVHFLYTYIILLNCAECALILQQKDKLSYVGEFRIIKVCFFSAHSLIGKIIHKDYSSLPAKSLQGAVKQWQSSALFSFSCRHQFWLSIWSMNLIYWLRNAPGFLN